MKQLLFVVMMFLPMAVNAQVITIDSIDYTFNNEENVACLVSGKTLKRGEVIIPETVEYNDVSFPVTAINWRAFNDCDNLVTVTIPNSVKYIDDSAFAGCKNLTNVTLGENLSEIGSYAFTNCHSLESIIIPNSVKTIETSAFAMCKNLKTLTIGNHVETIEINAFRGCNKLTSVIIPNSVISIESSSFSGCEELTSVTIGNNVNTIGERAFWNCFNLKDIYCLTEKVPSIKDNSFGDTYDNSYNFIKNITLHVPSTLIDQYKTTSTWKECGSIVSLDDPTMITQMNGSEETSTEYFLMNGQHVKHPQKGLHIIKTGKKTMKTIIR